MTGVGFLGAGAIVKNGASIRGLTTAAGLWCVAALGLASGLGLYVITLIASALVLLILWLLDYVESIIPKLRYRNVTVRRKWCPGCITQTIQRFKTAGLDIVDANFQRTEDMNNVDITLHVAFLNSNQYYSLERQLQDDRDYELLATRESS
jgi:putative Mg2+ transporter-C (MgtC) family protein